MTDIALNEDDAVRCDWCERLVMGEPIVGEDDQWYCSVQCRKDHSDAMDERWWTRKMERDSQ